MKNAFPVGTRLEFESCKGHYTVLKHLGRGNRTITYLCQYTDGVLQNTQRILKEYVPSFCTLNRDENGALICDENDKALFEQGKQRFCQGALCQSELRNQSDMTNQTPLLLGIHEGYNTYYMEVVPFAGLPLSQLKDLDFITLLKLMTSIARLIGSYHRNGYLCLDLKPDNIFVLINGEGKIITEMIEYIDFDSIRRKEELKFGCSLSFTRDWAAPEQTSPYSYDEIDERSDIYTLAEILFHFLFQRHSTLQEHRMFASFPFEDEGPYYNELQRLSIRNALTDLFSHTLRPSVTSRYSSVQPVISLLETMITAAMQKEYIHCPLPVAPLTFIGRHKEMDQIHKTLQAHPVLFISGMGGIGKTTLVRKYCHQYQNEYDQILMLNFDQSLIHTFSDDHQFFIQSVSPHVKESEEEYFERKLRHFRQCCQHQRVLIVIDQMNEPVIDGVQRLLEPGVHVILLTRTAPPSGYYPVIRVHALQDPDQLLCLFETHLQSRLSQEQYPEFFQLAESVQGHTLIMELIARQIHCAHLTISKALQLVSECGFCKISEQSIGYIKDDQLSTQPMTKIILSLFDLSHCPADQQQLMQLVCLSSPSGILIHDASILLGSDPLTQLDPLQNQGWIQIRNSLIRMHPVIEEAMIIHLQSIDCNDLLRCAVQILIEQLLFDQHKSTLIPFLKESPFPEEKDHGLQDASTLICSLLSQSHRIPSLDLRNDLAELLYTFLLPVSLDREDGILQGCDQLFTLSRKARPFALMKLYDLQVAALCQKQELSAIPAILKKIRSPLFMPSSAVKSVYYDMMGTYYDTLLNGDYFNPEKEMLKLFRKLLGSCSKAAYYTRISRYPGYQKDLIRFLLSQANLLIRHNPEKTDQIHSVLDEACTLIKDHPDPLEYCSLCSTLAWYYDLSDDEEDRIHAIMKQALVYAEEQEIDSLDIIDTLLIPYADLLLYRDHPEESEKILSGAIALCDEQEEILPYQRRKKQLMEMIRDVRRQ